MCNPIILRAHVATEARTCCYGSTSRNWNKVCLLISPVLDQIELPKFVHIHNSIFSIYSSQLYLMTLPRFYVWAHWRSCLPKCSISPPWCWLASSPSILHADWLSQGCSTLTIVSAKVFNFPALMLIGQFAQHSAHWLAKSRIFNRSVQILCRLYKLRGA